jgi:hypothetical protein
MLSVMSFADCYHLDLMISLLKVLDKVPYLPILYTLRACTQLFIHVAQGMMMLHAIVLHSFRASMTKAIQEVAVNAVAAREAELGENARKTLEREPASGHGAFLVGDTVPAADTMMVFSFSA